MGFARHFTAIELALVDFEPHFFYRCMHDHFSLAVEHSLSKRKERWLPWYSYFASPCNLVPCNIQIGCVCAQVDEELQSVRGQLALCAETIDKLQRTVQVSCFCRAFAVSALPYEAGARLRSDMCTHLCAEVSMIYTVLPHFHYPMSR
jgi:hypothetical protein